MRARFDNFRLSIGRVSRRVRIINGRIEGNSIRLSAEGMADTRRLEADPQMSAVEHSARGDHLP